MPDDASFAEPDEAEEQEYVYPQLVSDASMTRLCLTLIVVTLLIGAVALKVHDDLSGSSVMLTLAMLLFFFGW